VYVAISLDESGIIFGETTVKADKEKKVQANNDE
jgi:hypothetical protein